MPFPRSSKPSKNAVKSTDTSINPVLDWSTTPLEQEYKGHYLKIIDDLFTAEECASLIALAESDAQWKQAAVNYGMGKHEQYINTDYRNSERILRFDFDAAKMIYDRLLPHVSELVELKAGDEYHGVVDGTGAYPGVWKLDCLNERLSFLKYGKGHYFRGHCDGQLELPDGRKARVTVQIYLGDEGVEGGATRIWGRNRKQFYDVEPKKGRVLIFQQKRIWHTGEEVTKGLKYALRSDLLFRYYEDGEEVKD